MTPRYEAVSGAVVLLVLLGACSDGNPLTPPPPPPRSDALAQLYAPVWLDGGNAIGFSHRGLVNLVVDPGGSPTYTESDAVAGWWSVRVDGTNPQRRLSSPCLMERPTAPRAKLHFDKQER
jgi:hypothetical protein